VKFNQKSNFRPDWSELGLIRPELAPNGEKTWFLRAVCGIIFYVQVQLINLISSLNLEVYQTFSTYWPELGLIKAK